MTDRPIRASDNERESVVDVLRDAYTDGRLTLDEFEERTSAAYASKTWATCASSPWTCPSNRYSALTCRSAGRTRSQPRGR